jgi:hypothetical protein
MFRLAGLIREIREIREVRENRGESTENPAEKRAGGMEIIRAYDEDFRLQWDTLELFTRAELRLKKVRAREAAGPEISPRGWMPVVEPGVEEESEEPGAVEPGGEAAAVETRSEEAEDAGDAERLEGVESEEEEYLEEDEEMGFIPEFASLEELVRTTPRIQSSVVRQAILELCEEYKSVPELASALARSEMSLRRHYLSAMVREGLLEMEFPDRVGHPAQRYRTVERSVE